MNLHWPKAVRYIRTQAGSPPTHSETSESEHKPTPRELVTSGIYNTTLDDNHFRIAWLTASSNANDLVHVTLETYSDESHPEYETVSYLWGGEDDDKSLRRPIFVGPYWDYVLQTENCWSMLRFMRPKQGVRLVWVDALCINQRNLKERANQVAKMGQIYARCSRVVAYIGRDIVEQSTPFPRRRQLSELDGTNTHRGSSFGIKQMLNRRYFTRIWVIQELLLPERVVIRIGNTDFRADIPIMLRIPDDQSKSSTWWSSTAAPWVKFLGRKTLLDRDSVCDTFEVLRCTRQCIPSDARDRFFGVVALLRDQDSKQRLGPDYSISHRHLCIGLFAHWILNHGLYELLYKARTLLGDNNSAPTWLPRVSSADEWNKFLEPDLRQWPYHCSPQFQTFISDGEPPQDRISTIVNNIKAGEPSWVKIFTMVSKTSPSKPWNRGSYVNAATGALAINPIHLFRFKTKPRLIRKLETGIFLFAVSDSESINIYLTSAVRLDQSIEPGVDHMFMVCEPDDIHKATAGNFCYFVLREDKDQNTSPPSFQLLVSDVFLFEVLRLSTIQTRYIWCRCSGVRDSRLGLSVVDPTYSVADTIERIVPGLRLIMGLTHSRKVSSNPCKGHYSIQVLAERDSLRLLGPLRPEGAWQQIFPFLLDSNDLYTALLLMCRALDATRALAQRKHELLRVVLQLCRAEIVGDYFIMKFDCEDWYTQKCGFYSPIHTDLKWQRILDGFLQGFGINRHWSLANVHSPQKKSDFESQSSQNRHILLRAPTQQIVQRLMRDIELLMEALELVRGSYDPPLDVGTALNMVKEGPTAEQKFIGVPKQFGGVTIDGSIYCVEIL